MAKAGEEIDVRVGTTRVGRLARSENRDGSVFAYDPGIGDRDAVALSMPVRMESYNWERGLHPIFDMNLPEGALRDELVRRFRKVVRDFDDFELLRIVGSHQLGRLTLDGKGLDSPLPSTSVKELLVYEGAQSLFDDLLATYARFSGVSGIQPKVLIRDADSLEASRVTHKNATHLVKTWGDQFPQLAANEYFCMRAAALAGIEVPEFSLSENCRLLVVKRFDIAEGNYLGMEDFCVLSGWGASKKYDGTHEGAAKLIISYVSEAFQVEALERYFQIVALTAGVQNGDCHLKNLSVTYDHCGDDANVRFAPAYDIVSTTPYIPQDSMALLIGGSKAFPKRAQLVRFGRVSCRLTEARCKELLGRVAEGIAAARAELERYAREHEAFTEVAQRMLQAWDSGLKRSLGR